jgi:flagellar basal-body rod modification protein FlgD
MSSIASNFDSIYGRSEAPANPKGNLKSEDFINLLITQLQNQDPMEPMKNSELLQQVSQIGQLQSSNTLQTSLGEMVLQNQVSSAAGMIGKMVAGLGMQGEQIRGVVTTVRVVDKKVVLELDSGKQLQMSRITDVAGAPATSIGGSVVKADNTEAALAITD